MNAPSMLCYTYIFCLVFLIYCYTCALIMDAECVETCRILDNKKVLPQYTVVIYSTRVHLLILFTLNT